MIYWFTGQPGHGKTLSALDLAIDFKEKGRLVYVCNVRDFDYEKAGMLEMKPEDFINWPEFLPHGAVCLVDECYEKGMLPKRPPSAHVPRHVERLATHRHLGIDFIFICQSPDKQCDSFTHDLIDQHTHVRRMFGTSFINLRIFDRYEPKAERARPITIKRVRLPKRPMGLYKSTELDTTEKRIPWYYKALVIGAPFTVGFCMYVVNHFNERLSGFSGDAPNTTLAAVPGANGAVATVAPGMASKQAAARDYAKLMQPRVEGQPWTAPAYDSSQMREKPPRVFCASSGHNGMESCSCITDQGTTYFVEIDRCRVIARHGQFDPFYDPETADRSRMDGVRAQNDLMRKQIDSPTEFSRQKVASASAPEGYTQIAAYGDHGVAPPGTLSPDD